MINLEINHKEIDGAIFLSENMPYRCLKRWWEHTTKMLDHTIEFFQFCENLLIEINLDSQIKIPMIYERGSDWVLMDYDPSAISLNQIEENKITTVILDELYKACTGIHLKNSIYLKEMIENKSTFIRESCDSNKLMICGLELY